MRDIIIILYVKDQSRSREFYSQLLAASPSLDVPGMTEFPLLDGITLGLMPESGIAKLITPPMRHPEEGAGIPRCELYLRTADAETLVSRALAAGALLVRAFALMNWGETVAYLADPDGHVIAVAKV